MKDKSAVPEYDVTCRLSEFFKVLGDNTRLGILYSLTAGERSVQSICDAVGLSQSAVSHQLQLLRNSRLVRYRREGRTVMYALDDEHIFSIVNQALAHVKE